jgi:hypothetical protein
MEKFSYIKKYTIVRKIKYNLIMEVLLSLIVL